MHGFERPFHPLQITSWIVFTTDAVVFSIVGLPLLQYGETVQIIVGTVYFLSILALIFAWLKATWCDPSDPHLKQKDKSDFTQEEFEELPFCEDCNCPVFPRSKHCRACDKCVHVFDHHCKWLNNCVGQDNYPHFALAVSSVAVMTGIVLICSILILVGFIIDEETLEDKLREVYGGTPKEFVIATLTTLVVVNLPLCLLDVQLVLFHVFLTMQGFTTFEYIVNKRDLELEEEEAIARGEEPRQKKGRVNPLQCFDWIVYKKRRKRQEAQAEPVELVTSVPPEPIGYQETSIAPPAGGKSLNEMIMVKGHATDGTVEGDGDVHLSGVVLGIPPGDGQKTLAERPTLPVPPAATPAGDDELVSSTLNQTPSHVGSSGWPPSPTPKNSGEVMQRIQQI